MADKTFFECGCMEQGEQYFYCDLHRKTTNPDAPDTVTTEQMTESLILRLAKRAHTQAQRGRDSFWGFGGGGHHAAASHPEMPDDDSYYDFGNCIHADCVEARSSAAALLTSQQALAQAKVEHGVVEQLLEDWRLWAHEGTAEASDEEMRQAIQAQCTTSRDVASVALQQQSTILEEQLATVKEELTKALQARVVSVPGSAHGDLPRPVTG